MPYAGAEGEQVAPSVMAGRPGRSITEQHKTCPRCGVTKPLGAFSRNPQTATGVRSICKSCDNARKKEWARRNPDTVKAGNRRQRQRLKRKEAVLLRLAREDPEHFADVWQEEEARQDEAS